DASQSRSLNSCLQGTFDGRLFSFIKDVRSIREESFCNIIGTTMGFKANPFGWYYEIYPNCNKTNQYICSDNKSTPTS
ncbi:hypothetical protein RYX36_010622, partial [Vicia faba]